MLPRIQYLITFVLVTVVSAKFLKEGEVCRPKDGVRGLCKRKSDCGAGKHTKFTVGQKYRPCGFIGNVQLFCCPNSVKRAEKACSKYQDLAAAQINQLVSGGRKAEMGEFPHMVALWYQRSNRGIKNNETPWKCAGSLISERFVLTAAHCLVGVKPENVKIRVGDLDLLDGRDDANAAEYLIIWTKIHYNYNKGRSKYYDIGLVQTAVDVRFTKYVYPACIQTSGSTTAFEYSIVGWGSNKGSTSGVYGDNQQPLLYATVTALENNQCSDDLSRALNPILEERYYPQKMIPSLMCAQAQLGPGGAYTGTCEGDSGGPLQYYDDAYYIAGVTSSGVPCGGTVPGVYTRVSEFAPWIEVFVWGAKAEENKLFSQKKKQNFH